MKGLIPIVLSSDGKREVIRRLDTEQIIDRKDFEVLKELPVIFIKQKETIPQMGVFAHMTSLDFNEMPKEANAVLLSKRNLTYNNLEVYAGQYCHLK